MSEPLAPIHARVYDGAMDDWRDDYHDEPLDDFTIAGTFDEWADERARAGSASGPGETGGKA